MMYGIAHDSAVSRKPANAGPLNSHLLVLHSLGMLGELSDAYLRRFLVQVESLDGKQKFIHRKGATRALPARHPLLRGTKFESTGHPVLVPGSSLGGSTVFVADENSHLTHHSINHGAGRAMGRNQARRVLDQKFVDAEMERQDVMFNYRHYPIDELKTVVPIWKREFFEDGEVWIEGQQ